MKSGKLVSPPVNCITNIYEDCCRLFFLSLPKHISPQYIKVCMSETDLSYGLERLTYNSFSYLSCNGAKQATCNPYLSEMQRK